jgi:hypothetical protein
MPSDYEEEFKVLDTDAVDFFTEPPPQEQEEMDIDEWTIWYSNDLYNMWSILRQYAKTSGQGSHLLKRGNFVEFAEWCYDSSSKVRSSFPS